MYRYKRKKKIEKEKDRTYLMNKWTEEEKEEKKKKTKAKKKKKEEMKRRKKEKYIIFFVFFLLASLGVSYAKTSNWRSCARADNFREWIGQERWKLVLWLMAEESSFLRLAEHGYDILTDVKHFKWRRCPSTSHEKQWRWRITPFVETSMLTFPLNRRGRRQPFGTQEKRMPQQHIGFTNAR